MLALRKKPVRILSFAVALTIVGSLLPAAGRAAAEPPGHTTSSSKKKEKEKEAATKPTPDKATVPTAAPTAAADPASGTDPETSEPASLTKEEIDTAATSDALTVPTPGELFAALTKQCKPTWSSQYRGPISTNYSDRGQIALNLGGLIADGYIAVEAMDSQQVKNLGRDILALAKNLGVSKEILARANSITQFAEDNDWGSLKEELEATQNEVKQALDALHDEELVTLLSLGGWIRGTQVVSSVVLKNFSDQTASILRQPALVGYLRGKLDKLSPKTKDSPLIKQLDTGLDSMEKLISFPLGGTASKDDVQKLNDQASGLVKAIATKQGS